MVSQPGDSVLGSALADGGSPCLQHGPKVRSSQVSAGWHVPRRSENSLGFECRSECGAGRQLGACVCLARPESSRARGRRQHRARWALGKSTSPGRESDPVEGRGNVDTSLSRGTPSGHPWQQGLQNPAPPLPKPALKAWVPQLQPLGPALPDAVLVQQAPKLASREWSPSYAQLNPGRQLRTRGRLTGP